MSKHAMYARLLSSAASITAVAMVVGAGHKFF